jgi:hypothetical protein
MYVYMLVDKISRKGKIGVVQRKIKKLQLSHFLLLSLCLGLHFAVVSSLPMFNDLNILVRVISARQALLFPFFHARVKF